MSRVEVAPAAELTPGERRLVMVDDRMVGVLNVEGELYAIDNECAHDGGPVCQGLVHERLVADVDPETKNVTERLGEEFTITCPWHGWEYDVKTGDHVGDADLSLPTYDVIVEDGTVYVRL